MFGKKGKGREGEELTPSPPTIDVSTSLSICAAIWHTGLCQRLQHSPPPLWCVPCAPTSVQRLEEDLQCLCHQHTGVPSPKPSPHEEGLRPPGDHGELQHGGWMGGGMGWRGEMGWEEGWGDGVGRWDGRDGVGNRDWEGINSFRALLRCRCYTCTEILFI